MKLARASSVYPSCARTISSSSAIRAASPPCSVSRFCSERASHTSASPCEATSRIASSSRRKRSCRSTPTRAVFGSETEPPVAVSSPATMLRKVVLPEPLAPTRPYRWPGTSLRLTSSKRERAPYDLPRFWIEIMNRPRLARGALGKKSTTVSGCDGPARTPARPHFSLRAPSPPGDRGAPSPRPAPAPPGVGPWNLRRPRNRRVLLVCQDCQSGLPSCLCASPGPPHDCRCGPRRRPRRPRRPAPFRRDRGGHQLLLPRSLRELDCLSPLPPRGRRRLRPPLEASLATDRPALAFTTTGPGLTNALTPLRAAQWDGGHVPLVSRLHVADPPRPARHAGDRDPHGACVLLLAWRAPFHYAAVLEHPGQLGGIAREAAERRPPQGGVAGTSACRSPARTSLSRRCRPRAHAPRGGHAAVPPQRQPRSRRICCPAAVS